MVTRRTRAHVGGVEVRLTRSLERSVLRGHPWIWRDAFRGPDTPPGTVVAVLDRQGRFVARGVADEGPIGVRVFTTNPREPVDAALFERRVVSAAALRDRVVPEATNAYRLLHGEGDRLPGVVCDVYDRCAVFRIASPGVESFREAVLGALMPVLKHRGVTTLIERGGRRDAPKLELLFGELPNAPFEIEECGMRLLVDITRGQKTGLFLDHRDSRAKVRGLARGARVLNLYGYTGAFSIAAGLGGATRVETVDLAAPALSLADDSWRLNELPDDVHSSIKSDVHEYLAQAKKSPVWDLVISDPPSFAPNEASLDKALHAYTELHRGSLALLPDGGLYLAASCSSHVRREAFEETLLVAAGRLRRPLTMLGRWGAGPDHPGIPAFVEGDYLKALLVRVG